MKVFNRQSFTNMLSSLRKKSDNEKLFISVGTAAVLTIVIAVAAYGLPDMKEAPVVKTDSKLSDTSVFANIKEQVSQAVTSVKQGVSEIGKLKETMTETASVDSIDQIDEDLNSLNEDLKNL